MALVLAPGGASKLSVLPAALCFAAGGVYFYWLDAYLSKLDSAMGQLVAMLSNFIPEAIALGAVAGFLWGLIGNMMLLGG